MIINWITNIIFFIPNPLPIISHCQKSWPVFANQWLQNNCMPCVSTL